MKKLLFAFMAVTLFACSGDDAPATTTPDNGNPENPEPVGDCLTYQGNKWLRNQAEVNAFVNDGYCKIQGELYIGELSGNMSDIYDLSVLAEIVEVTSGLTVSNNPELESLNGLQNINNLPGIRIQRCNALVNLNNAPGMISGCNVFVQDNDNLITLEGLSLINCKNLFVERNNELVDLLHLQTLTNVKNLRVTGNGKIVNLQGFENITDISDLWISGNPVLVSLQGFDNVAHIQSLHLNNNGLLASIEHLHSLTAMGNHIPDSETISPYLSINSNNSLVSLHGLENLSYFGGPVLDIKNNYSLTDFCALTTLFTSQQVDFVSISSNKYNVSQAAIKSGNCSQP